MKNKNETIEFYQKLNETYDIYKKNSYMVYICDDFNSKLGKK